MTEQLRVLLWTIRYYPEYAFLYWKTQLIRKTLLIHTSEDTIAEIISNQLSISRFGDGELQMMQHYQKGKTKDDFHVDTFQDYSRELASRLWEVFLSKKEKHLNCLPYQFKNASISKRGARMFWQREWLGKKEILQPYVVKRQFGDTNFTRFYMSRKDIEDYPSYIMCLKNIWNNRRVVLVEGAASRAGVGNDLFDGAKSVKRVICPPRNAFDVYSEILNAVKTHVEKDLLVLICLGHTATVLAYDLSLLGYQAIDLGHVDIEYEWYRMGAKRKISVPDKYVNEVADGRVISGSNPEDYTAQIIATIHGQ